MKELARRERLMKFEASLSTMSESNLLWTLKRTIEHSKFVATLKEMKSRGFTEAHLQRIPNL